MNVCAASFGCSVCTKQFKTKPHLRQHIRTRHPEADVYSICPTVLKQVSSSNPCLFCKKRYSSKFILRQHIRRIHPSEDVYKACPTKPVKNLSSSHRCNLCEKTFISSTTLRRHSRNIHRTTSVDSVSTGVDGVSTGQRKEVSKRIYCSVCKVQALDVPTLRRHIKDSHPEEEVAELHEMNFATLEDFLLWKKQEEKRTLSSFVKQRRSANSAVQRYYCHRSGDFRSSGTGKRHLKIQEQVYSGSCGVHSMNPLHATSSVFGGDRYKNEANKRLNMELESDVAAVGVAMDEDEAEKEQEIDEQVEDECRRRNRREREQFLAHLQPVDQPPSGIMLLGAKALETAGKSYGAKNQRFSHAIPMSGSWGRGGQRHVSSDCYNGLGGHERCAPTMIISSPPLPALPDLQM